MKAKLKALGARLGPFVLTALVALGVGYWSGRKGQPARVEQSARTEEKTKTVKTEEKKTTERVIETEVKTKRRVTVVKRVKFRKDGSKESETETTEREDTEKHETGTRDRHSDTDTTENTEVVRTDESHSVRINSRSDWRITALVGAQLQNPLKNAGNPFSPNLFLGLNAERRIFGPLWGGLFVAGTLPIAPGANVGALGSMYAGVSVSVEF